MAMAEPLADMGIPAASVQPLHYFQHQAMERDQIRTIRVCAAILEAMEHMSLPLGDRCLTILSTIIGQPKAITIHTQELRVQNAVILTAIKATSFARL